MINAYFEINERKKTKILIIYIIEIQIFTRDIIYGVQKKKKKNHTYTFILKTRKNMITKNISN